MTPEKMRKRLEETSGRVDPEEFVAALEYVREDGHGR